MKERSLIEVENVKKVYGDKLILKNINLKVDKGEFVTIIGSSGCGKTTFLKLINGLVNPDFGQVYINNYDISKIDKIALRGICCLENIVSSFQRTSRRDEDLSCSLLIILIKMAGV